MISLDSIETEQQDGETVIPDHQEDKLLDKLADKVSERIGGVVEVRGSDPDSAALEDVWIAGQPLGKIIESNRKTADEANKKASASGSSVDNPQGSDTEDGSNQDDILPIERLSKLQEASEGDTDHPALKGNSASLKRAITIFDHFGEWSKKTPKGHVIKSNLKSLLNTATGESLAWRQVYRAAEKLAEWSKESITFKQHRKHGWMLIREQSSSAATG